MLFSAARDRRHHFSEWTPDSTEARALLKKLAGRATKTSPFATLDTASRRGAHYVQPDLVAQVPRVASCGGVNAAGLAFALSRGAFTSIRGAVWAFF